MTTVRPTLAAAERTVLGKAVATIRREGRLPAVVFGHGVESRAVSIDGGRPHTVMVRGVQVHPVTRRPLHVDLMAVRMTEEITVDVPIVTIGESHAVDKLGGTLVHGLGSVKVRALPARLPQLLELSIESLDDFGKTLHVRDLAVPAGVAILADPDEALVHVVAPRIEEVPVAAEAAPEAAGAAAEGAPEAAAPDASTEG